MFIIEGNKKDGCVCARCAAPPGSAARGGAATLGSPAAPAGPGSAPPSSQPFPNRSSSPLAGVYPYPALRACPNLALTEFSS